jgi:uncharacterized protein (DUF427 family)
MKPPRQEPGPGQESVWDYPRPPALVPFDGHVKIFHEDRVVADSRGAYRVLETSHPPTFYIPPGDVDTSLLEPMPGSSLCEWKGQAAYFRLRHEDTVIDRVAWIYPSPTARFATIGGYFCFYPSKVRCFVNGEGVKAQEGDFYGGWITSQVVGPFKGGPGTWGW